ncbi:calcium uptake protein 3, mitochondrial isoform X3 [Hypomesus transpacificus]|uniref:calcium uptake protein 3, mitochondrial isoform X3 n=1 Tax=Hypomesus transpacificus TaxID=137520 RepID=UPI001F07F786|nr:calcium uptake protein 3, mitochondrial isoform X3 [Hypomesus transpacificus]
MAALRRLISTFTNFTYTPGRFAGAKQQFQTTKTLKLITTGVCLATGAGIAHYCNAIHNMRIALASDIGGRWLLSLPSVSAKDKAKTYDLDDGDVYMSSHENRFRMFCSVEYEGQLFMTPLNFIESVTMSEPKKRRIWKSLSKQDLENILENTPPVSKGTSNLFRNMRERGIICYTEYLFLLCILTKPHAGFKIAFNMFDADGNQMVDKREFLVLKEIFRKKKDKKEEKDESHLPDTLSLRLYGHREPHAQTNIVEDMIDTTLLVHFFGKKGKAELNFDDFYSFMDNLQTEVLEIEFLSYSRGLPTISEEDFARILLRYTNVENISAHIENMRQSIPDEKGITFEEFRCFFQFLNNLEDFAIAMQMYNFANRSIGQDEFTRAVYVATGLKLTRHLVNTVFKIFDEDHDDKLSYKEFIGVMKDRLHRSQRGFKVDEKFMSFKSCLKKQLSAK